MATPALLVHDLDDSQLRQRAAAGCRAALQELLERHVATAVRSAHAILGNREDALDVAQETLLKLAAGVSAPWRGGSTRAWVAVVAQRIAVNRRKGEQMRKRREEEAGRESGAPRPEPHAALELAESLEVLRTEVSALPETSAEVLLLYYIQHLPITEIARQTGLSADACKQRLARGREELGERMRKRGILLACLLLLTGLSTAADACASEVAPQGGALAAKALRLAPKHAVLPQLRPAFPVILATVLLIGLGSLMARDLCARSSTRSSSVAIAPSTSNQNQENPMLKTKLGRQVCAAALAIAASTAARAEEQPAPPPAPQTQAQASSPQSASQPVETKQNTFYTVVGPSVQASSPEVHVNVDDVAKALKDLPEAALAGIPGEDLTAKAKSVLENPSIPKTVVATKPIFVSLALSADASWPSDFLPPGSDAKEVTGRAEKATAAPDAGTPPKQVLYKFISNPGSSSPAPAWQQLIDGPLKSALETQPQVAVNLSSAEKPQIESIQVNTLPPLPALPPLPKLDDKLAKVKAQNREVTTVTSTPIVSFTTEVPAPLEQVGLSLVNTLLEMQPRPSPRVFEAPTRVEGKDYIFKDNADKKDDAKAAPETPPAPPTNEDF